MARKEENQPRPAEEITPIPLVSSKQEYDHEAQNEQLVIPLVEEHLLAEKQWVQAGEVVVRKTVETRNEIIPVDLGYEEVQVERVPINRLLAEGEHAQQRQEGNTLIIPVVEEQLVVHKQYFVREEVRITKRRSVRQEEVSDTVRSEQISIEPMGNLEATPEQHPS